MKNRMTVDTEALHRLLDEQCERLSLLECFQIPAERPLVGLAEEVLDDFQAMS